MELLNILNERRELVRNLVSRELKIRYRGSVLGFLWTLLIPLFMAAIYVIFLRMVAGRGVPMADIIIGVFAWQFTVQCVNSGLNAITGNVNLVKKVYFPRIILVVAQVIANLVNYMLSLAVQIPAVMVMLYLHHDKMLSPLIVLLPVVLAVHFIFNLALALLLAATNVYYRDVQHLAGVFLSAWFFVSPVMYNLSFVEQHLSHWPWVLDLYMLNPIAVIVTAYRAMTEPGVSFPISWAPVVSVALIGVTFVIGLRVFRRLEKNFADLL